MSAHDYPEATHDHEPADPPEPMVVRLPSPMTARWELIGLTYQVHGVRRALVRYLGSVADWQDEATFAPTPDGDYFTVKVGSDGRPYGARWEHPGDRELPAHYRENWFPIQGDQMGRAIADEARVDGFTVDYQPGATFTVEGVMGR